MAGSTKSISHEMIFEISTFSLPVILSKAIMKQTMQKHWEAYKSNNPDWNEYMQTDYESGFEDGWKANKSGLRAQAAMSAMNALIQKGNNSPLHTARLAVSHADALIKALNDKES